MKIANILKAEFKIYKKSGIVKAVSAITFSLAILFGFLIFHSPSMTGALSFLALMKGYNNAFNFSLSLTCSVYNIIIIFIIIMGSTAISDEAQKGTLKTILVKRVKRNEYIIGKSLLLLGFFVALIGIVSLLSLALGGISFGLSDISEKNYIIHSRLDLLFNYFLSLFLMIFPISALVNFSLFFSVLFNNNLISLISCLGMNFVFYICSELDFYKYFFLSSYLSFPIRNVQRMAQGLPLIWSPQLEYMLAAALLYSAGFLILAIVFFKNKEIA
jgi:ABC-2 type transport system permease protein